MGKFIFVNMKQLLKTQNFILYYNFTVKTDGILYTYISYLSSVKAFETSFLNIFKLPFISAFINKPLLVLNNPLFNRVPK